MPQPMIFDHSHPLWDTYYKLRMGLLTGQARAEAKALLHPIIYGAGLHDMSRAEAFIQRKKEEQREQSR